MIKLTPATDYKSDAPETICVLTLDAPPENRWHGDSLEQLHHVLGNLARQSPCPSLVITGSGSDWFCGGTLESALTDARVPLSQLARLYSQACATLRKYPALTVAAINGQTRDEGVALALSCDFRVASGHTRFGFDAPRSGRFPMGGSTQLLPRLLGESVSKRMLLCGLEWGSAQALEGGLVDEVNDSPVAAAITLAASTEGLNPLVVQGIRQLVEHARMRPLETGFAAERDWQATLGE
ncbi:enoyl-CoA hydratase-related protein [Marinobacter segnicrescens]|uniref:enoyl-CoA hydratase-related protein n=1 Tax=Marinobacter segnicrescens TaxID=430453 RepID=UPI003A941FB9